MYYDWDGLLEMGLSTITSLNSFGCVMGVRVTGKNNYPSILGLHVHREHSSCVSWIFQQTTIIHSFFFFFQLQPFHLEREHHLVAQ